MLVLTFIGGPLHADRRMAEAQTRTYVHTKARAPKSWPADGRLPRFTILRHVYDAMDTNEAGEIVYLYRGVRGATAPAQAAPG